MPVKTSIIILTYNELELTKKCLASIKRYTDKDKIELIIVDNGSSDGTREYISNLPDVKVILNEKTSGSPRGATRESKRQGRKSAVSEQRYDGHEKLAHLHAEGAVSI